MKAQDTKIKFFGQPGFENFYNTKSNVGSPYFRSGSLVFFMTSQLNEKFSVAAELNAHYMVKTGAEVEVERLYIKYDATDKLSFRFGKMYTPIGFWNLNYNYGLILQPTITRPSMMQPTHDGGFINTRDAGFQVEGSGISPIGIFYKVFVFNGVGKNGGFLGVPYRLGETPGATLQLGVEPTDGLKISLSSMYQVLQKGYENQFGSTFGEDIHANLFGASISHMNGEKKFEFICEAFLERKSYKSIRTKNLYGAFVYSGYKLSEKFVPYIFAEHTEFDYTDIFLPAINAYTGQSYASNSRFDLGIRYKYSPNLVFKLEGEGLVQDRYGFSLGVKSQVAFSF